MIKPEHGHKPIKTEATGSKPKQTSKPTQKQKPVFNIDVKNTNGELDISCKIKGYSPLEILGMLELIRIDFSKHLYSNPTIRDEKDDLL